LGAIGTCPGPKGCFTNRALWFTYAYIIVNVVFGCKLHRVWCNFAKPH
jgi:hypothetical protein